MVLRMMRKAIPAEGGIVLRVSYGQPHHAVSHIKPAPLSLRASLFSFRCCSSPVWLYPSCVRPYQPLPTLISDKPSAFVLATGLYGPFPFESDHTNLKPLSFRTSLFNVCRRSSLWAILAQIGHAHTNLTARFLGQGVTQVSTWFESLGHTIRLADGPYEPEGPCLDQGVIRQLCRSSLLRACRHPQLLPSKYIQNIHLK